MYDHHDGDDSGGDDDGNKDNDDDAPNEEDDEPVRPSFRATALLLSPPWAAPRTVGGRTLFIQYHHQ